MRHAGITGCYPEISRIGRQVDKMDVTAWQNEVKRTIYCRIFIALTISFEPEESYKL